MQIAISNFVRRQHKNSSFSYFSGLDEELINLIKQNWDKQKAGYRNGVMLIPVDPTNFYSAVFQLEEGDSWLTSYEPRQPGEEPRRQTKEIYDKFGVKKEKTKAKSVDVVLYRHDVLAENNEQSSDAEWEVISINARPTEGEEPIRPMTLISNHFQLSGGTATNLNSEDFVEMLKRSVLYWKDKITAGE